MEPAELQTNLEELEERIDRVRALYEQYFCGIEKLEPQIPRKDVDRRIFVLRKEQIRNTAMRFKFQTLVQRYNTMSQHWGRVLREIENGTFKRDLARAAARFGIDDALTAVGKKRAKGLAKGLEAQLDREGRRKQQQKKEEEYEVVDEADFEAVDEFDDDAPTPPPVRVGPPPGAHPLDAVPSIDDFHDDDPRTDISEPPGPAHAPHQRPTHTAFGRSAQVQQQAHYAQPTQAQPHYAQPQAQHQQTQQPQAQHLQAQHPQATPYMPPVAAAAAQRSSAPAAEPKKAGGGLRLGGGPVKRVNQAALNRIAGALDDDDEPPARRPLMSAPLDIEIGPEPAPPPAAAPPPAKAQPAPSAAPARKPLLSAPIDIDIPLERPSAPPAVAAPPPAPSSPSAAPEPKREPAGRALGLKPPPKGASDPGLRPQPKPSRSEDKDLSDQRLREIYAQYVNTRRERNESTAGITFEKLADSLRSQADKLKSKHTAKKVDYEVVVKDGKTLIKPIVR